MSQQILDLQRTLRDLRAGVALKLGVTCSGDAPLIGACAQVRHDRDALQNINQGIRRALGDLRMGIAESIGTQYNGDKALLGACAALRDELKATQEQLAWEKMKFCDFRCSVAEAINTTYIGDKELLAACTDLFITRKMAKEQLALERSKHADTMGALEIERGKRRENTIHLIEIAKTIGVPTKGVAFGPAMISDISLAEALPRLGSNSLIAIIRRVSRSGRSNRMTFCNRPGRRSAGSIQLTL